MHYYYEHTSESQKTHTSVLRLAWSQLPVIQHVGIYFNNSILPYISPACLWQVTCSSLWLPVPKHRHIMLNWIWLSLEKTKTSLSFMKALHSGTINSLLRKVVSALEVTLFNGR